MPGRMSFTIRVPAAVPTLVSGSFASAARGGAQTHWMIARPPGPAGPIRPVIALHGRDGSAAAVMELGVENALAALVAAGYPPFAVVSVDGGNGYWHRRASGQDSGAMVLTELLPMLHAMGFDTSRVGFIGWLKTNTTLVVTGTFEAPLAGSTETSSGSSPLEPPPSPVVTIFTG